MVRDHQGQGLYSIGQFAKRTGFPVKTLRFYDQEGVLKPAVVDPETGYRFYTEAQRRQMHLLAEVHIMQVPLDMLREFIHNPTLERQGELFDWKIQQLEEEIRERQHGLESLKRRRASPWRGQEYDVVVEERPSKPLACVHYVTRMSRFEADRAQAFDRVRASLKRHGVTPAGPPMVISLPIKKQRDVLTGVEVYAGFEVSACPPAEDLLMATTPAGQWCGVTHTGPYEHIWHVMGMLLEHLQRHGDKAQGGLGEFLQQEVFHVGPWDTLDAGAWVTDVRWLVRVDDPGSVGSGGLILSGPDAP